MPVPDQPRRPSHAHASFRTRHRAQSHDSAHANYASHGEAPHEPPHPHALAAQGSAELITDDAHLAKLIAQVRASGSFAYDSEFIGELSYHPKLCLIQIATTERVALVDPLAELDLAPFWELLCDDSVEKIVHAGEQDLEPATRILGRACANVFDTQIAAGFAGLAYPVSLSKLVQELVGARLGKGLTFSHWDQRPLSGQQLRYAANDVRYLPAAHAELIRLLERLGHVGWARAECSLLCDPARYVFDPDREYLRMRGANALAAASLAVLRELTSWRDRAARDADVPPRAFLRDEVLVDLARSPVKSIEMLSRVRGLPRPVEQEHGRTIVELTTRALASPPPALPAHRHVEPTPTQRFRIDALWALVQSLCCGQSIDPALVISRADVVELDRLLHSGGDLSAHRLFQGWRRDAIGDKLLSVVRDHKAVSLEWNENSLRAEIQ
jgi:ribonuclease D